MPLDPTQPAPPEPSETPSASAPVRVRVGRYGELDTHELVHLLDSIDTERERARFRESLYISLFFWIALAWFLLYGPRLLWHQPKLINPADVLRAREMTELTAPTLPHLPAPRPQPAQRAIDPKTMEHLKAEARTPPPPAPTPQPEQPSSAPAAAPQPLPPTPQPQPAHTPPPVVADAPSVQPSTRPNFGTPNSPGSIRNSLAGTGHDHGSSVGRINGRNTPLNMGGAEVLSDTQGVDFNPYLRRILSDIYRNWLPLIPPEVQPPLSKEGQAYIRFTILPDGSIGAMHLDGSTHDDAINKSCWGSITTEGQFPPLPSQFHGPNLELRIHYIVSKNPVE